MLRIKPFVVVIACLLVGLMAVSCGKSGEQGTKGKSKPKEAGKPASSLKNVVKDAIDEASLDDEFAKGRTLIESAGFVVKSYKSFPAEEVTKKGRVLIYTDKQGKHSGGVLYVKRVGFQTSPAWHWYFEDMVPDSVDRVELNHDGLWDIRIVSTRGQVEKYIQDEAFTLSATERNDWIAMNGSSSPPASEAAGMWRCFDGDTTTAWKSPLTNGAFLEFEAPFGVKNGNLTLCAMPSDQPRRCTVYADGKQAAQIEFKPVAGRQLISLGQGVVGAKKIRLEFTSTHDNSGVVAVAELGLD
jgi:hypothetical protein